MQPVRKWLAARRATAGLAVANSREHNNADNRFLAGPEGALQMGQYGVAVLVKGMPFPADCALPWPIWDALHPKISHLRSTSRKYTMNVTTKYRILIGTSVAALVVAMLAPRIAQDPLYHQFADRNAFLSIPNTLNVLTNLLFGWIGIEGLYRLLRQKSLNIVNAVYPAYQGFFAALILIAAGSGYYHWTPDNQTLVWDRLPMTLAFMSFFTILLAERISVSLARMLFPVLIGVGIASIIYWNLSEQNSQGDLRPYALIQFLPMLLIPLILLLFTSNYSRSSDIWWFLAWYLIAKICETFDAEILNGLKVLSGHSLKHIAASIGCLVFLRHLRFRKDAVL